MKQPATLQISSRRSAEFDRHCLSPQTGLTGVLVKTNAGLDAALIHMAKVREPCHKLQIVYDTKFSDAFKLCEMHRDTST